MKKGFTLIELLVVISIIGVLMGLLLVSYQGTKKTARDGKRKADLEQIRSALEMYKTDCGSYPSTLSFGGSLSGSCPTLQTYMSLVPQDPLSPTYSYRYSLSGNTYTLCACLETGGVTTSCTGNCGGNCGSAACNYKVCNP